MGGSLLFLTSCFSSVVVRDLDYGRTFRRPHEADPKLIVDPNRMLASAISFQGGKPSEPSLPRF